MYTESNQTTQNIIKKIFCRKKRTKTFKLGIQIILSKQKNILEKNLIGMCIVFMGIVLGDSAKFTNYLHIS